MIDYMSHITSSSGGSDTLSGTTGLGAGTSTTSSSTRGTRVRTVRLVRPPGAGTLPSPGLTCRHGPGLGFSLRGGREHGTGFFVSAVEVGSEAHRQGLKLGDQIIRVNGFTVEDAVHKEVLQLISNHTHLTLKVRSVGMIPVKDKSSDPLSWQIIPDFGSVISESPPLEEKHHDVRINIAVAQRAKLGCGICKGPEWKPGIFVQFTKEGGIARDAGLRPGDQILYCNNVDFIDISFNDAVNIMKTSRQLDLVVRKGAGSELFPGESSGYNSSASSVTGDQSPSWSDSKRLSIVKEESLELEDRLSHLDFHRFKPKCWEKITYDWDENPRHFKPTIINLSEKGTTITNNGTAEECHNGNILDEERERNKMNATKLAEICLLSQQHETTKMVVVDVHRSDLEDEKTDDSLKKSPSIASFSSTASRVSSSTTSSLSSAITLELQRRSERNKEAQRKINIDDELQKKKILKSVDSEKKQQHDKLMDEFKRAHRKMFNSLSESCEEASAQNNSSEKQKEPILKDRQLQLAQRRCTIATPEEASERLAPLLNTSGNLQFPVHNSAPSPASANGPPPPPPMPCGVNPSTIVNGSNPDVNSNPPNPIPKPPTLLSPTPNLKPSSKPKAPPVPQKTYQQPSPPPCPTPDYDTLSINSSMSNGTLTKQVQQLQYLQNGIPKPPNHITNNNNNYTKDCVDMDSLESFKLNNPCSTKPKPPNTYFNNKPRLTGQASLGANSPSSSQNSTIRKQRPVSVTIGEYPSGSKRQPIKFEFLNGNENGDQVDGSPIEASETISSRFASELAQTLSRSNLRKRTEKMENAVNGTTTTKPQLSNGSIVTISVNTDKPSFANSIQNQHKLLTKSQSTDVNMMRKTTESTPPSHANRVTIKISDPDLKNGVAPSSILKNGNNCSSQHKPLVHQKSITFGEMPTVINDHPMHVS